jgi:hypothetical protein
VVVLPDPVPARFVRWTVAVAPGERRPSAPEEWCDALVVVVRGELEVERASGPPQRLRHGDVLWLAGVPVRALRNRGPVDAVLVAVARRAVVGDRPPPRAGGGPGPPPAPG